MYYSNSLDLTSIKKSIKLMIAKKYDSNIKPLAYLLLNIF